MIYEFKIFFATDRVREGELQIYYCPNERMMTDLLIKPFQGAAFWIFFTRLMNINVAIPDTDLSWDQPFIPMPHECVG